MHFPDSEHSPGLSEADSEFTTQSANHQRAQGIARQEISLTEKASQGESSEDESHLLFRLGNSVFGVPALAVRTIHALPALLPLQETAPFIVGVFNLRGAIVPVMDLNTRFGLSAQPYRLNDNLVVLNWNNAEIAILVNEVYAVKRILPSQIESTPEHSRRADLSSPFLAGVAKIDDDIVMLLHLPHLLQWTARETPSLSVEQITTRQFDSQQWSAEERTILQERATRLRLADEAHGEEAQNTAGRAPVAIVALGGEEFGVALDGVREFASITTASPVPCCPPHILGQINLRGDIVTLVDVRQTLRTARTTPRYFEGNANLSAQSNSHVSSSAMPVVVVQYENAPVGIVVDELRGVLYLREDEHQALDANTQSGDNGKYFSGGALHDGRLLPLLDVTRLFDEGGLAVEEHI